MVASTVRRVPEHTSPAVNARLQSEAEARLAYYAVHPHEIEQRLRELDAEWDVERAIETEAASTILLGLGLGWAVDRRWFLLPVFASAMLLLHNLNGAYPLLSLFRRLGLRTQGEIAAERYALKALRGDFERVRKGGQAGESRLWEAFEAARPHAP
ncbi:hypothetical protein ACFOYU_06020 [Microvirga sp. GCM10011540]|uniref:hypothetical protein n=1 Tax=Microvirga sp. GCM10011540 TaxID=3317338 RepID=UPI003620C414